MIISSAVNTGLHLSVSFSYALNSSTPGACNIEMQTFPSGQTWKYKIIHFQEVSFGIARYFSIYIIHFHCFQLILCSILTVWMPHFCDELHLWWHIWVIIREANDSLEQASIVEGILRAFKTDVPFEKIIILQSYRYIQFAVLVDHWNKTKFKIIVHNISHTCFKLSQTAPHLF